MKQEGKCKMPLFSLHKKAVVMMELILDEN